MKKKTEKILILKNPLIIALDVDSAVRALDLAKDLSGLAGGYKIGPRLALRYGEEFVKKIAGYGPVFLDNKHFDIPSTMVSAVRASFEAGASLVTVHALSGVEALEQLSKLEAELNQIRPFKILAVSVLTSWNEKSLPINFKSIPLADHVKLMQETVVQSGLDGLVCSSHELSLFADKDLYIVTPGIRFSDENLGDQKRVMGPAEALKGGAAAIVVGRPIIEATNPKEVVLRYLNSLK